MEACLLEYGCYFREKVVRGECGLFGSPQLTVLAVLLSLTLENVSFRLHLSNIYIYICVCKKKKKKKLKKL